MAAKKAAALTAETKAALVEVGLDLSKIDWKALIAKGLSALLVFILQELQNVPLKSSKGKKGAAHDPDCDHVACAYEVLVASLETARLAASHYEECCCEIEAAMEGASKPVNKGSGNSGTENQE